MADITFSSPKLDKDMTVYAVAGDTGTILSVAEAHGVPIPFDCKDGNCGSCLIEVRKLDNKPPMGVNLTEKEKELLLSLGRISAADVEKAETSDVPPPYRLACQYIVRDEDILVRFAGEAGVAP